ERRVCGHFPSRRSGRRLPILRCEASLVSTLEENPAMAKETLTVTDNRTGKSYEIPIADGAIRAGDLRQIKVAKDDPGLQSYDPAFVNTAACKSAITFIDGDRGILRYRGYPIEQLAEQSTFLEVAYLIVKGELPAPSHLSAFVHNITHHTMVHENIKK